MKQLLSLFVLLFSCVFAHGQTTTVSGYVVEKGSGERLIGATVYETTSKKGVVTNGFGFYSLTLEPSDSLRLVVSYVGCEPRRESFASGGNIHWNVELDTNTTLAEVTVTAEQAQSLRQHRIEMSSICLPVAEAKQLPSLGGETDVLKALQLMPGVQSGNEGNSGLYVRGGSPDQNLIVLDDVPLYYVNHLGGLVSVFNADAINSGNLIKGGFPARYGNRLSSVLDIRMRDGNQKETHGNAMISLVTAKAAIEGPIKPDTCSYLISFRRFMYDIFMRPISKIVFDNVSIGYSFHDFNAKINYRVSEKDSFYLSMYLGNDNMTTKVKEKNSGGNYDSRYVLSWGNRLLGLRWNHVFNPKLFCNTTLAYTRYHYQNDFEDQVERPDFNVSLMNRYLSSIDDIILKSDLEYYYSDQYKMALGASSVWHGFSPNVERFVQNDGSIAIDTIFGDHTIRSWENAAYIENIWKPNHSIGANIGLRIVHYSVEDTNFVHLEPRLLLNWQVDENLSLKTSYARMFQNIHMLTNAGAGLPVDLWLPATSKAIPETSSQVAVSASMTQTLRGQSYSFSVEGFYKRMEHLISYKAGSTAFATGTEWTDNIETDGKGTSIGVELLARKETGQTTGWIGCTLSRTDRQFSQINDGRPFLFKYDHPLDLSLTVIHRFTDNIKGSLNWVYCTGNAISIPIAAYQVPTDDGTKTVYVYDGINTFRMRSYHRLDLGISFEKQKKKGTRVWNVSVYNAYNRMNPYYYTFDVNWETNEIKIKQVTMFPILPSVGYEYRF